jgi:hypothetical protein
MIKPTIGRKVWFRPAAVSTLNGKAVNHFIPDQPFDATIVCVWGDRMVNLLVVDHGGETHAVRSVTLRQEGDNQPGGMYCEWMPYQTGQARAASN